ncbi:MAG: hypothetical protein RL596_767 [Bacteroidota bacterium]|jgi:cytidine deaminase
MKQKEVQFSYEIYSSIKHLEKVDAELLQKARAITENAYAPYSNFQVGAVAKLADGSLVNGTNQENASFPAGLCAERVLVSAASSFHPGMAIETMAISYHNLNGESKHPISPCGVCRQTLVEFERRQKKSIRLILGGLEGKVYVIPQASLLMPLSFTSDDLK